ncbi:MAG: peptidoglycan-binding protein LysM, partial [Tannerella sp.]|nr:peptidoglycan-binding protein LysM [Tannerella sp.]
NFFADNLAPTAKRFNILYHLWYGHSQAGTFPKYGMLGFDTGLFFLDAMARYGLNFEQRLKQEEGRFNGLQTDFNFRRVNNWGGFINDNLFIVHYNRANYRVERRQLQR